MKKMIQIIKTNIIGLGYYFITTVFFFLIFKFRISTDIQTHIQILNEYLAKGYIPNPPLYYLAIYVVDLFAYGNLHFVVSSILVLSFCCYLKFILVTKYLLKDEPDRNRLMIEIVAFSLMFISPVFITLVDGKTVYLGKFTSTIWHNSTTIFVFPICLWLFLESLNYLNTANRFSYLKLFGISILIVLSKPSFLFPFIVVFPIISVIKFGWQKTNFLKVLLFSIVILSLLILQKSLIYQNSALDKLIYNGQQAKVIIAPFQLWMSWTSHPVFSILTSFLFLISVITLKPKYLKFNLEIGYSFCLLFTSLVIFFLFAESGPRFNHGNFYWQIPISVLIINMVIMKVIILPRLPTQLHYAMFKKQSLSNKLILLIYSLHFFSGFVYIIKIIVDKDYT